VTSSSALTSRKVGVLGASGFVGGELLRLLAGHPAFDLVVATGDRQAGQAVAMVHPHLAACYPDLTLAATDAGVADGLDVVFTALPHGASAALVPDLLDRAGLVVDLGADFRLKDPGAYPVWYGQTPAAMSRPPRWLWPPWCGPGSWSPPASSSTPPAA
jgi:N-acetyl-gamma-glutamyl-phosphate reductase